MNHPHGSTKSHIIWMLVAAGVILAALLAFQVNTSQALPLAIALACPLGMVAMMFFMGRSMGGHRGHGADPEQLSRQGQHTGHIHEGQDLQSPRQR